MKSTSENSVVRIDSEEFKQSVAITQLAVKLCELERANPKVPLEKENLDPGKFLGEAWKLIEKAHEHVLRPQTEVESFSAKLRKREKVSRRHAAPFPFIEQFLAVRFPFVLILNDARAGPVVPKQIIKSAFPTFTAI
jgi:hypothetical protein